MDMFSRLKDFVEENSVDTSDLGIDQCIRNHSVNLLSKFSKYFPGSVSDIYAYKWIRTHSMMISPQINTLLLKKKIILALYLIHL